MIGYNGGDGSHRAPRRRLTLFSTLAVILWGALVRATGAGAGCGRHWPLCNGVVVPRSPGTATLVEMTHRLTSGIALAIAVAFAVLAFRRLPRRHPVRAAAAATVVFFLGEAAIGAGLVLFELVAHDASLGRAMAMGAHLANTFLLVGAITLGLSWSGDTAAPRLSRQGMLLPLLGLGFAGLMLLGASGAVAALGDTLFPAASLAEGMRQDASPAAHVLLRLRVLHPLLAVAVAATLAAIAAITSVLRPGAAVRGAAMQLAFVLVAQLAFGIANLVLLAPVWTQLIHLLLADLCVIAFVRLGAEAVASDAPRLAPAAKAVPAP